MADERTCPHCGKPIPPTALQGICPECMLQAGFPSQTDAGGPKATPLPPAKPEDIAPLFPNLEILECLGRGGMGAVYKARQPKLNRLVALKVLAPEKGGDPKFADRFLREAQALAQLNHPNIVTIHDFGETGGLCYLLMEFVDGLSLRQLIQTRRLPSEQALTVVPRICDALQFAHEQGIVHRDIKPENILLDKRGRVKIADFGIAKIMRSPLTRPSATLSPVGGERQGEGVTSSLTEAGKTIGTPHYMAPEQIEKPSEVDHRADIYSLGVVFYEMLTGELPLGKFAVPSQKVQVDVRLDEVVLRALEKEPERRYQQASVLRTEVETIAADAGKSEVRSPKSEIRPRFSRIAIAGAGWALLHIIGIASLASNWHETVPAIVSAALGTTVLGWVAVSQIRRSAGRIYGLGLAVFDGLLFPLLALGGLIAASAFEFLGGAIVHGFRMPRKLVLILLLSLMVPFIVKVEWWIVRAVWRALRGSLRVAGPETFLAGLRRAILSPVSLLCSAIALIVAAGLVLPNVIRLNRPNAGGYQSGAAVTLLAVEKHTEQGVEMWHADGSEVSSGVHSNLSSSWQQAGQHGLRGIWFSILVSNAPDESLIESWAATIDRETVRPFFVARLDELPALGGTVVHFSATMIGKRNEAKAYMRFGYAVRPWRTLVVWEGDPPQLTMNNTANNWFAAWNKSELDIEPVETSSQAFLDVNSVGAFVSSTNVAGSRIRVRVSYDMRDKWNWRLQVTDQSGLKRIKRLYSGEFDSGDAWGELVWLIDLRPEEVRSITLLGHSLDEDFAWTDFGDVALAPASTESVSASTETLVPHVAPGEKPDLEKIRLEANDLMNRGRYEDALQRYMWYHHHALEDEPSLSGVRLSSGLYDWIELGRRYPKAKQALIEIRDAKTHKFAEGGGYAQLFQDVASINSYLQDDDATSELFKEVEERDKTLAQQCYLYAETVLVERGEYALCLKCIGDPQARFDLLRRGWEMQMADDNFIRQVRTLVEILVGVGRDTDAHSIRDQAVAVLDVPELQSAVADSQKKVFRQIREEHGSPATNVPAQALDPAKMARADEMRRTLLAAKMYADAHNGEWPVNLSILSQHAGQSLIESVSVSLEYNRPTHIIAPTNGVIDAFANPVLFEKTPESTNGQWVGFADGHLVFVQDVTRLRELRVSARGGEMARDLIPRYEAAKAIRSPDERDKAMAAVVRDAARLGDWAMTHKALSGITDGTDRDDAAGDAARLLSRFGRRAEAMDIAKTIGDSSKRDAALRELAE